MGAAAHPTEIKGSLRQPKNVTQTREAKSLGHVARKQRARRELRVSHARSVERQVRSIIAVLWHMANTR